MENELDQLRARGQDHTWDSPPGIFFLFSCKLGVFEELPGVDSWEKASGWDPCDPSLSDSLDVSGLSGTFLEKPHFAFYSSPSISRRSLKALEKQTRMNPK